MDAILLQLLNGLDKGGAYALIALGLTLIFGTLGVVNFAHGALFMLGAFCAVTLNKLMTVSKLVKDPAVTFFDAYKEVPYLELWFGEAGARLIDYAVPLSILLAIPVMLVIGVVLERGIIRHFYRRPHADQILVTFGLAIVLQEIVKAVFGANPIPTPAPRVKPEARPIRLGRYSWPMTIVTLKLEIATKPSSENSTMARPASTVVATTRIGDWSRSEAISTGRRPALSASMPPASVPIAPATSIPVSAALAVASEVSSTSMK